MKRKIQTIALLVMLYVFTTMPAVYAETNPTATPIATDSPALTFQEEIPDENFRKFINETIFIEQVEDSDILNDSKKEELKNYSGVLDISKQKISDITGISYFEGITSFIANGNTIQSLTLSGMQYLQNVQIAYNKLSQISLTNLPALESIDVSYNCLSALDVCEFTNLKSINCTNNELTALDISHLTNLKSFFGGGNQFLSFDLSSDTDRVFDAFELWKSHVSLSATIIGTQYGIVLPERATAPNADSVRGGGLYLSGTRSIVWSKMTNIPSVFTYDYPITGTDSTVTVTVYIDKTNIIEEALSTTSPLNFTATNTAYDKIKLSWKPINGVDGYRIYRSTTKNGTYSLIKTASKGTTASYINTSLTTGTTYYYKMRAFRLMGSTKYFGEYTSVISKKAVPQKTTLKLSKYAARKIKLTWGKINGISGYYIYRSTSKNGTYKKIKKASKTATSYINTKRTKGVTYYYRIRAYCKVDGETIYGVYSAKKHKKVGN